MNDRKQLAKPPSEPAETIQCANFRSFRKQKKKKKNFYRLQRVNKTFIVVFHSGPSAGAEEVSEEMNFIKIEKKIKIPQKLRNLSFHCDGPGEMLDVMLPGQRHRFELLRDELEVRHVVADLVSVPMHEAVEEREGREVAGEARVRILQLQLQVEGWFVSRVVERRQENYRASGDVRWCREVRGGWNG